MRVRGIDAAFLHNETRSTLWHIVGVLVLDPSTAPAGFDADVLRRVIADRIEHVEAFRRRVVDVRGGLSVPHWVVDDTVDVTRHVRRASVPGKHGLDALAELVARTAPVPLPRDRPLWLVDVIDDLGDGRVGVVAKVHHSIMDGTAAVSVLGTLFDLEPTPPGDRGIAHAASTGPRSISPGVLVEQVVRLPVSMARTAVHLPGAAFRFVRALRDAGRSVTLPLTAPRTSLNRSITPARSVSLTTLPMAEVREVATAFDVTINDVAIAMCAGALRAWLRDAGELPDRPLVAAVPVALRGGPTHAVGNRVSVLFAAIPTHLEGPRERLEAARAEMRDAKATHDDVGPHTVGALAEAAPWNVVALLFRVYSDLGLATRLPPPVNLILSNVRGPEIPVYCGGARLEALFPLGPIFDGAALNVTIISCGDDVDVGVVTCPDVAPAPVSALAARFRTALDELLDLARSSPPGAPPADGSAEDRPLH